MRSRKWLLTGLTVTLALLVTACGGTSAPAPAPSPAPASGGAAPAPAPSKPPTPTKVRFSEVIHSVFYAPQYVAEAKGFFKDEGIELDTSTAQGSDKGMAAILAGTADIALVGPETNIFLFNQEGGAGKVKIFTQLTAADGSFMLSRQPVQNFQWSQLKGKTIIGWRPGSMPEMVLEYLLRKNGLKPGTDVTVITNIASPAMAGAFTSGQGDYITLYEPTVAQLEKAKQGYSFMSLGEAAGPFPETVYLASSQYIKDHSDLIQRYTNAIYKAQLWMQKASDADVAQALQGAFKETDIADLTTAVGRYRKANVWRPTPVPNPADIERLQDIMVDGGVLTAQKRVKYADIIDDSFAKKAMDTIK